MNGKMDKAVLISIRPKWCELIANGKKTIEVRKTKPKLQTPFKCYIYQTKTVFRSKSKQNDILVPETMGKVIGEFICDGIIPLTFGYKNTIKDDDMTYPTTCLTDKQIIDYVGDKCGYGWHISELEIYDEPKELSEFYTLCEDFRCEGCEHLKYMPVNSSEYDYECEYDGYRKPINRAPQSWCYIRSVIK